jgi:hypothetical protein
VLVSSDMELHPLQAPRDKLVCILNCCRVINNLLHVGHDGDARGALQFIEPSHLLAALMLSGDVSARHMEVSTC